MDRDLDEKLDKNKFRVVKYGLFILLLIIAATIGSLFILKINDSSIIQMVVSYYLK